MDLNQKITSYIDYLKLNNFSDEAEENVLISIMQEELALGYEQMKEVVEKYLEHIGRQIVILCAREQYEKCVPLRDFRIWLLHIATSIERFYYEL